MNRQHRAIGLGSDHREAKPMLLRFLPDSCHPQQFPRNALKAVGLLLAFWSRPLEIPRYRNQTSPLFKGRVPHRTRQFIGSRIVDEPEFIAPKPPTHHFDLVSAHNHGCWICPPNQLKTLNTSKFLQNFCSLASRKTPSFPPNFKGVAHFDLSLRLNFKMPICKTNAFIVKFSLFFLSLN